MFQIRNRDGCDRCFAKKLFHVSAEVAYEIKENVLLLEVDSFQRRLRILLNLK